MTFCHGMKMCRINCRPDRELAYPGQVSGQRSLETRDSTPTVSRSRVKAKQPAVPAASLDPVDAGVDRTFRTIRKGKAA